MTTVPTGQTCSGGQCLAKTAVKETAKVTDSGVVQQCPSYCNEDRDCSFCKNRLSCDLASNTCIDARQQCPEPCSKDEDCRVPVCGSRQFCDTAQKKCGGGHRSLSRQMRKKIQIVALGAVARKRLATSSQRPVSSRKTLAVPPLVPAMTSAKSVAVVADSAAKPGRLREPVYVRAKPAGQCPASCTRTSQCYVQGCGDKLFCNYLLRKCTNAANACPRTCQKDDDCPQDKCGSWTRCTNNRCADTCPRSCKADKDCSKDCGARTFCYKYSPTTDGYCRTPPTTTQCPDTCRTSYDCKAKACGSKSYCNYSTRKCTDAAGLCPSSCKSNADCAASKCGNRTVCNNGRCWTR